MMVLFVRARLPNSDTYCSATLDAGGIEPAGRGNRVADLADPFGGGLGDGSDGVGLTFCLVDLPLALGLRFPG